MQDKKVREITVREAGDSNPTVPSHWNAQSLSGYRTGPAEREGLGGGLLAPPLF